MAGSEWRPLALDGYEVPADTEAFIAFRVEGQIIGNGGCNQLMGSYAEDGVSLSFGPIASTKTMCPDCRFWSKPSGLARGGEPGLLGEGCRVLARFAQKDWD